MNWFQQWKDILAIAIALLAVVLSLLTVFLQRTQRRRDAYREIYDRLMSYDLHRGRWLIRDITKPDDLPKNSYPDYRLIYRTLGVFDNLAMYVAHGVVPKKWMLEVWHHPLLEMQDGAEVVRRDAANGRLVSAWPQLWELFRDAHSYRGTMCCHSGDGSRRSS